MSTRCQEQWIGSLQIGDSVEDFDKVWAKLADGNKVPMLMRSSSGVMISIDQEDEPIVPLGWQAKDCR